MIDLPINIGAMCTGMIYIDRDLASHQSPRLGSDVWSVWSVLWVLAVKVWILSYLLSSYSLIRFLRITDFLHHFGWSKLLDHLMACHPTPSSKPSIPPLSFELYKEVTLCPLALTLWPAPEACEASGSPCVQLLRQLWSLAASLGLECGREGLLTSGLSSEEAIKQI